MSTSPRIRKSLKKKWSPWTPSKSHIDTADQCGNMHHCTHSETVMIMTY